MSAHSSLPEGFSILLTIIKFCFTVFNQILDKMNENEFNQTNFIIQILVRKMFDLYMNFCFYCKEILEFPEMYQQ